MLPGRTVPVQDDEQEEVLPLVRISSIANRLRHRIVSDQYRGNLPLETSALAT
jgi:hypothetical protein